MDDRELFQYHAREIKLLETILEEVRSQNKTIGLMAQQIDDEYGNLEDNPNENEEEYLDERDKPTGLPKIKRTEYQ